MKVISLNTWGGRAGHENFLGFIKKLGESVGIFCLQEIWYIKDEEGWGILKSFEDRIVGGTFLKNIMGDQLQQIEQELPNHQSFFRPHFQTHYGLAMFVRKDLELKEEGEIFVYKHQDYIPDGDVGNHARNIQHVTINTDSGLKTIINFHGLWNGKGKTDTEDRLAQSDRIIEFLRKIDNPFVLCGDFNLLPDTQSLNKFEEFGLRNLIKENNITSTRTSLYTKEHKFADYIFVSGGIKVNDFKVLPDEISDHLAMYLDFE